jgi:hypothetical protein
MPLKKSLSSVDPAMREVVLRMFPFKLIFDFPSHSHI